MRTLPGGDGRALTHGQLGTGGRDEGRRPLGFQRPKQRDHEPGRRQVVKVRVEHAAVMDAVACPLVYEKLGAAK